MDGCLLPVYVCVLISSSYKDTGHTELGPTLQGSFNLIAL